MPEAKVFDRADLLNIFDASGSHGDLVGGFQSKRMVGDLPPMPVYEKHTVYATTSASFSEKNLWLIVEHGVHITNAGEYTLPADHPYRRADFGSLTIERGLNNSADICRKVMEMAKKWSGLVEADCPAGIIGEDEPSEYEKELEKQADAFLAYVAAEADKAGAKPAKGAGKRRKGKKP